MYERVVGVWEDEFDSFATCSYCLRVRRDFCPRGYVFGKLRATIWHCHGIDYVTGEMVEEDEDEEAATSSLRDALSDAGTPEDDCEAVEVEPGRPRASGWEDDCLVYGADQDTPLGEVWPERREP